MKIYQTKLTNNINYLTYILNLTDQLIWTQLSGYLVGGLITLPYRVLARLGCAGTLKLRSFAFDVVLGMEGAFAGPWLI